MTQQEERYIAILEKRADHLEKRINSSDRDLSYDKAELAALDWAVDFITDIIAPEVNPAKKQV
jgi:hypothetical protein